MFQNFFSNPSENCFCFNEYKLLTKQKPANKIFTPIKIILTGRIKNNVVKTPLKPYCEINAEIDKYKSELWYDTNKNETSPE